MGCAFRDIPEDTKITENDLSQREKGLDAIRDGKRVNYRKNQRRKVGDPHPLAGNRIFYCGKGIEPCQECFSPADYQCDFPIGDGKTCDFYLCEKEQYR